MRYVIKRLLPGQDLREEIESIVQENHILAGAIVSIVGSLTKLRLRIADGKTVKEWDGQFEIVSGTGTLSQADCHIHISVAGVNGVTIGGHLKQGCIVGTTVEIVVLILDDVEFKREPDATTGYDELVVHSKKVS